MNNLLNQNDATEQASTANNGYILGWVKRWYHKLLKCPTFWRLKPRFTCPKCGKKYRCYWDGNDIEGLGIDYCNKCAKEIEDTRKLFPVSTKTRKKSKSKSNQKEIIKKRVRRPLVRVDQNQGAKGRGSVKIIKR